jgi:acyl carrier protein
MILLEDIQDVVNEALNQEGRSLTGADSDIDVDSLGLVWIQFILQEKFHIDFQPERSDVANFTSARAIHEYLAKTFPEPANPEPEGIGDPRDVP